MWNRNIDIWRIKTGGSDCIDEGTESAIYCNKGDERRSEETYKEII